MLKKEVANKFLKKLEKKYTKAACEKLTLIIKKRLKENNLKKENCKIILDELYKASNFVSSFEAYVYVKNSLDRKYENSAKEALQELEEAVTNMLCFCSQNADILPREERGFFENIRNVAKIESEQDFIKNMKKTENAFSDYRTEILTSTVVINENKFMLGNLLSASTTQKNKEEFLNSVANCYDEKKTKAIEILNELYESKQKLAEAKIGNKNLYQYSLYQNKTTDEFITKLNNHIKSKKEFRDEILKDLKERTKNNVLMMPTLRNAFQKEQTEVQIELNDALEIIKDSFKNIIPSMVDFIDSLIEDDLLLTDCAEEKLDTAFAAKFAVEKKSIVFMQYKKSIKDVITLAHEIGHAFHHYQLKDQPKIKAEYTKMVAETASMFAEIVVSNKLKELYPNLTNVIKSSELIKDFDLMILVPSRFDFEMKLITLFEKNKLNEIEVDKAYKEILKDWFNIDNENECLSSWITVRHYFFAEQSFYNYPYYFGYLLSLELSKDYKNDGFNDKYLHYLKETCNLDLKDLMGLLPIENKLFK